MYFENTNERTDEVDEPRAEASDADVREEETADNMERDIGMAEDQKTGWEPPVLKWHHTTSGGSRTWTARMKNINVISGTTLINSRSRRQIFYNA